MYYVPMKGGVYMSLKRLSINLDEKVVDKVDQYAESIGVNRTAAITFLITQGLSVAFYPDLIDKLSEISKQK